MSEVPLHTLRPQAQLPAPQDRAPGRLCGNPYREKEFFIDNLLVRIHLIIEMVLVDRPCAIGV